MNRKAFTLIEIMIVVAVLALLAGIAVPALLRAKMRANETSAQATLKTISAALESYAGMENQYPDAFSSLTTTTPPYFARAMHNVTKGGYTYACDNLTTGGYTVTASAYSAQTGNWDYQITTGAVLKRSEPGQDNWQFF